MALLWVCPAPGRRVRDPRAPYPFLPDGPQQIEASAYFWRRMARGDLIPCDPPTDPASVRKTKAPKTEG